eukprot:g4618.t1
MNYILRVLAAVLFLGVVSQATVSLDDLEGIWTGPVDLSFLLVLTDTGVDSICRSSLTPECEESLPQGTERFAIVNGTIAISFITLVGVDTKEKAAKLFPECAKSGVFPFQTVTPLPPAEIQSYDPNTGHLTFIDSRRPDDINCVIIRLKEGKRSKPSTISIRYVIASLGSLSKIVEVGPSFRCIIANDLCINQMNDDGELASFTSVEFELPCKEGDCLNPKAKFLWKKRTLTEMIKKELERIQSMKGTTSPSLSSEF